MSASAVLVTGATGFIGQRLTRALIAEGHHAVAMTRSPEDYDGPAEPRAGDVEDASSLAAALQGCDRAYYLIHSLDDEDFAAKDAEGATAFAEAAAAAGLVRIVYLGGLGRDGDDLSEHLRSRRQVEEILQGGSVPVTVLRAGIIIGDGGDSWEMTYDLVTRVPLMPAPRWVETRTQPIAVDDVVAYLVAVLGLEAAAGGTYEVGGPDVMTYQQMIERTAAVMDRPVTVVKIPLITRALSRIGLSAITTVDSQTAGSLVESMVNEVVVTDDAITRLVPRELTSFEDAVRQALDERELTPPSSD